MRNRIKLSKYAKQNGISYMTAYRHFNLGYLNGIQLPTGTILVNEDEVKETEKNDEENRVVLYARVSSSENKDNLERQLGRLRDFANAKGYKIIKEIKEVGSGLNDKRKKLETILNDNNWDIILVEHKDRLARFGLNYLEVLLNKLNKKIEIINETKEEREDLMQDFISIITSFCSKIYGQRRNKRKTEKIIKELENDE